MTFTLDDYAKTVVQPSSGFVDVDFTGTIFTWRVYSTDDPGHYAYRSNLVSLVSISAAECQIAGGACGSVPVNYSIDAGASPHVRRTSTGRRAPATPTAASRGRRPS